MAAPATSSRGIPSRPKIRIGSSKILTSAPSNWVAIPKRHLDALLTLLETAAQENQADRYVSAEQMHQAVDALLEALTHRPVNPDNSQAFTLYSLKNMLEGSQDTRYSCAQELYDRRGVSMVPSKRMHEPVAQIMDGLPAADADGAI